MRSSNVRRRRVAAVVIPMAAIVMLVPFSLNAFARGGGGTAKPPPGAVSPFVTPTLPDPIVPRSPAAHIPGLDDPVRI